MLSRENFNRLRKRALHIAAEIIRSYSAEAGRKQPSAREAAAAAPACVRVCAVVAPARSSSSVSNACPPAAAGGAPKSNKQWPTPAEEAARLDDDKKPEPVMRPLSLIDLELMSHCYDIDWSLVFNNEQIDVPRLRDALAHALGAYPSLAARVVSPSTQGTPDLFGRQPKDVALLVGAEREGVWFTAVDIPLPLPRFVAEGRPEQLKGLICDEEIPMFASKVNQDLPIAHFTVIQFEGAGILNMRISHCVVDGTAFGDFVAHLAACYTRLTALLPPPRQPAILPCEDRIAFDVRAGLPANSAVRNYGEPSGLAASFGADLRRYFLCDGEGIRKQHFVTSPLGGATGYMTLIYVVRMLLRGVTDPTTGMLAPGPTHMCRLLFDHAQLKRLKAEAIRSAASAPGVEASAAERLSTNDVLCGLIWKAVETNRKHRGMFDYTSSERSFFMPVNVRGRLSPPMPEVFGNAVVLTVAKLDIRRLADCSVGEIALKLRENKANITPETIADEMRFVWDSVSEGRFLRWSMDTFNGGLLISDWTKFSFVTQGEGLFGRTKPIFAPSIAGGFRIPYFGIIYEPADNSGLLLDISLPDDEREAFLRTVNAHASGRPRIL